MLAPHLRSCFGFVIISPTIVWITPMLPLRAPPSALPMRAIQKLVASPTDSRDTMVPKQPRRTTGFLPIRSERAPQKLVIPSAKLCWESEVTKRACHILHRGASLRKGEGCDENSSIEGCITLVADFEVQYEFPRIREYRSNGNRFGDSHERCTQTS